MMEVTRGDLEGATVNIVQGGSIQGMTPKGALHLLIGSRYSKT